MITVRDHPSPLRPLLVALAALLALCLLGVGAGAARAHDQLLSSSPAEGERLERAPRFAELEFSGQISPVGVEFALRDGSGALLDLPTTPRVDGRIAKQELPELTGGDYTLDWRVVSEDGHPISGTIAFAVGDEAAGAAGTGGSTAQSRPEQSAQGAAEGQAPEQAAEERGPGVGLAAVGVAAAVVALGGAFAMIAAARRRGRSDG
ncbi:MAG: copper resistance protein CopC [Pseudoclavibacter sp.]|nr:copper resistance protein CopC [Pseudoclavibacter sp.]